MAQLLKRVIEFPVDLLNRIYVKSYYKKGIKCPDIKIDDLRDEKTLVLASRLDMETRGLGGSLLRSRDFKSSRNIIYIGSGNKNFGPAYKDQLKSSLIETYRLDNIFEIDQDDPTTVKELLAYLEDLRPDRIYSPFIFNGDRDQLRVTSLLLRALELYDEQFSNIWMYESSTPNDLRIINRLVKLNRDEFKSKTKIYENFKSSIHGNFDVYGFLDRKKAILLGEEASYGAESFIKLSYKAALDAEKILLDKGFEPEDIYGFTSKSNLLASFLRNKSRRVMYNNNLNYALKARFIENREEDYGL